MLKVCFLSDFLFHDAHNKATYHNWFFNLCTPIFKYIGIKDFYEFINHKNKNGKIFSRDEFFKISNIFDYQYSYYSYDINKIKKESWDYFFTFIDDDTFILGFELGEDLRIKLDEKKVNFINFWIHSFKLFYDITFMANTNSKKIFNVLKKYQISPLEFNFFGNFWKTYIKEKNLINDASIIGNSVLFIGQMPKDQSVRNGNTFLNITNFKDEIEQESKYYNKIYYQEHPAISSCKDYDILKNINDYIESTPYIEKLPQNIKTYSLLSSEKIKKVISLSSSVVYEATFFGKNTKYLYKSLFNIDEEFGINTFISINNKLWSCTFWLEVFNINEKIFIFSINNENGLLEYHKDYLRDIRNFYFGYTFLDREFFSKNICVKLNREISMLKLTNDRKLPDDIPSVDKKNQNKAIPKTINDEFKEGYNDIINKENISKKYRFKKFYINLIAACIPSKSYRHKFRQNMFKNMFNKHNSKIYEFTSSNNRTIFDIYSKKFSVKSINGDKGINSIGFFYENIGLSHAARYFTRTLLQAQINFCVKHFQFKKDEKSNFEFDYYMNSNLIYNTNVFNLNSNYAYEYYKLNKIDFTNRYNILYPYWEYDKYPINFLNICNFFDEIWCPSNFILETLSKYHNIPCVKMPLAINFDKFNLCKYDRKYFNIPEDKFIFLFSFDCGSEFSGRKNVFDIITSFNKSFNNNNHALLIIKVNDRKEFITNKKYIDIKNKLENVSKSKNIILINKLYSDEEMKGLIKNIDVYISLHRCEGLGLGMMEAMKLGKPVIATNYSGNTEFMKTWNSCLVDYELTNSPLNNYKWANPDLDHASYYMRKLYQNSEYYKKISYNAEKYINEYHSTNTVALSIKDRLILLGLF